MAYFNRAWFYNNSIYSCCCSWCLKLNGTTKMTKEDRKLYKLCDKMYKLLKKYKTQEHIYSTSKYYMRFTRKD